MKKRRDFTTYLSLILALLVLTFIVWTAWQRIYFPYDGFTWSLGNGYVQSVDSRGPAATLIQPGDHIVAVDQSKVGEIFSLYQGKHSGDTVTLLVEREKETRIVQLRLTQLPWLEYPLRLMPALVSLVFWGIGLYVLAFKASNIQCKLFFSMCMVGSAALAAGSISAFGPEWVVQLFSILIWWIISLTIDFHLYFPLEISPRRHPWRLLLYVLPVIATFPSLFWDLKTLYDDSRYIIFRTASRLWLAFGFITTLLLLINAYKQQNSIETKRKIRLIALGAGMALVPFSFLTLLPDVFFQRSLVPYDLSLIFLLAVPLAYGYAIARYRFIHLERYINNAVASSMVVFLVALLYVILYLSLTYMLPSDAWQQPGVNVVFIAITALIFGSLHRRLQRFVNHLFYGGWYDYKTAVSDVSEMLAVNPSPEPLAKALTQGIVDAMQLECACIYIMNENDGAVEANKSNRIVCTICRAGVPLDQRDDIQAETPLIVTPKHPACSQVRLWFTLAHTNGISSKLFLGSKRGGGDFTENDLAILQVIVRQASFALQNAFLISELKQQNQERVRLYQQNLRSGDKERTLLARELHDRVIQDLVGINYHLAKTKRELTVAEEISNIQDLQSKVQEIVREVRCICTELRPPALDGLGLVPAIRAHLNNHHSQKPYQVLFQVDGAEEDLPEEIALCLFRVIHEGLANVQKHSQARKVIVWIHFLPQAVTAFVEDDGIGFSMPQRLGELTNHSHFGLVGLQERVELVHGELNILTSPGRGCRINVHIPR